MKELFFSIVCLGFCASALGQNADREVLVRQVVRAFYSAYHDGFVGDNEFAAEDWNHINPAGGWTRGRENVLKEVREVHSTFLKGVTDTVEEISIGFASPDVAVATVISRSSKFVTPDGVKHEHERNIRTFVVVNRGNRWLVMHDQNTIIRPQ
jgi:uncharacterized protein (TIGR02246 family)